MPNTSRLLTKKQIISLLLIICTGIVTTFWFLGCNKTSFENGSNNSLPGDEKTLPKPTDGTTPADHSPLDNYYIATGVLRDAGSFVGNTTGLSTSLGITQEIKAGRTVLGKDVFKESYSFGVKKVGMQFYVSGKSYVMRDTGKMSSLDSPDWSNSTPYKVSEETFVGKFGGKPLGICNYIVEDDTVLDGGKYLGLEDGLHAFRYDFDTSKATTKMLREMLTMSGMESSFTRAAITVYMDSDWVVKKTTTDCEYVVAYGMVKPSCTESITEVFTALGEKTPLPLADVFSPYLDAEETELTNKEPTALDYIMSGFGAYMAGTPLVASVETSGLVSLKGAASVNIDINNLSNIKARVQIDELGYDDLKLNDVFVVYSDDTVYIKYADLRAKGTISDAKELVKKLAALIKKPTQDEASGGEASGGEASGGLLANLDASAILDSMTLTCEDGKATVGITIPLGDVTVNATLEFTDGDTVTFLSAAATICKADGSELLAATILPVESAEIPELEGKYYDLVPLVNELIDDEGNICLAASLEGITSTPITLNAKFNLASMRLDASGKLGSNLNDLKIRLESNTVYLEFGDLKASFNLDDVPVLKDKFGSLFASSESADTTEEKPSTAEIVKSVLDTLAVKEENGKLTLSLTYDKLGVSLTLTESETAYGFGEVRATFGKLVLAATTCKPGDVKLITSDLKLFRDILPVTEIVSDELTIELHALVNVNAGGFVLSDVPVDVYVDLNTLDVMAKATIFEKDIFVKYSGDTVYVSALGIRGKASKDDISSLVKKFTAFLGKDKSSGDAVSGILEALDLDSIIASLNAVAVTDGVKLGASMSVNGVDVALGVTLKDNGTDYRFGGIDATAIKDKETLVSAVVEPAASHVDFSALDTATLTFYDLVPLVNELIDDEGNICLAASLEGITSTPITLNAKFNLASMRLDASGKLGSNPNDLKIRLESNTVYLEFGDLKASFNLDDVPVLKDKFGSLFASSESADTTEEKPSTAEIVKSVLDTLAVKEENGKLTLSLTYDKLGVSLTLTESETAYGFGEVRATFGKLVLAATTCKPGDVKLITSDLKLFRDILPVTEIVSDELTIELHALVNVNAGGFVLSDVPVDVYVDLNTLDVMAKATIFEKDIFVKYSGDTVYVSALGIRGKASKDDISSLVKKFTAFLGKDKSSGDAVSGILEALDLDSIIASLNAVAVTDGVKLGASMSVNGVDVALGVTLKDNGTDYRFGGIDATAIKDKETLVSAVVEPAASHVDFSALDTATLTFYDLVPLVNELIDYEGNIKLRLTIDTDIADSLGDAISGAISGAITDITDGKTEFVEADKKPISVLATFNIRTKRLTANVLGIKLMLDLDTKMVYAECGGAKLLLDCGKDFANVQSILEKLAPTIRTFVDDFEPNVKLDLDLMTTIEKLVKAIDGKPDESGVTLSLPVTLGDSEADVTIRLDASETSGYSLGGVKVTLGGTVIIAKIATSVASAPAVFDEVGMIKPYSALKAAGYVGLNEVIDSFADTINNICTAENLIVDLGKGCEVSLGDTTIALSGNIKVAGVNKKTNNGVIKVNADLVVTITKNGSAKTYRIIVIYTTPLKNGDKGLLDGETPHYSEETTTDENGNMISSKRTVIRPNAYFKLDRLNVDGSSTNEPVIGTFSTANIKETMNTLKTIYNNMPELQGALSFAIPESKDGKFHMPSIEDVGKLVGGLTFDKDGKRLNVSIKVSSLIHDEAMKAKMSEPITVSLLADADGDKSATLGVVVGLAVKGDNGAKPTTVKLNGTANTAEAIDDGVFTYRTDENPDRTSDFSSIDTLLGALAATSANDHFELDGTMKVLLYKPVKIECKIDVINKKTYATLKVTREHVPLVSLWQDYSGTTTVYFDGSTDTVYMNCDYYEAKVVGIQYKGTHKNVNYKFTKEEFTSKLADILLKNILPINKSFLGDGEKSNTEASIEKIFTKYSYDNNNNFTINLNVGAFTSNVIKDVNIDITKDGQTDMLTTLRLSTKILSVVSIELGHDENGKFVSGASLKCNNFGYKELDDYSKVDGQKATAYSAVVNYRNSNNNFSTYA